MQILLQSLQNIDRPRLKPLEKMGEKLNDHILFRLVNSIGLLQTLRVLLHNLRGSFPHLANESSQLLNFAHLL